MRFRLREIDLLAALAIVLCTVLTYTTRHTLNPDGVSYLDLAALLGRRDWAYFVQGYWSPLYPALLALASAVTGKAGAPLLPAVHLVNGLLVLGAIGIIWVWARRLSNPWFGRAALAAFLLCGARPPRVEAITPDLLLLLVLAGLTYELVLHGGRRWLVVGVLLGTAFLAKTSTWPWLAVAVVVLLLGARDRPARRNVIRSTVVCAALMLLWVVPMSLRDHRFTLGSAGRLNACWYLEECDSRTPDSHTGAHVKYQEAALGNGARISWVPFENSDRWTYEPWSDPAGWDRGVVTRFSQRPDLLQLLVYWLKNAGVVFGLWLAPLFLAVLLPMLWVGQRPGMGRALATEHRSAFIAMILGFLGLGQFIAVHAEPRLIAPFALMLGLGALAWLCADLPTPPHQAPARRAASWIGGLVALGFLVARIRFGVDADRRITTGIAALEQTIAALRERGITMRRIAIIGPAMPVTSVAYAAGGRIVAQIPPRSVESLTRLAPSNQQQVLTDLFAARADVAWLTKPEGGLTIVWIRPAEKR